ISGALVAPARAEVPPGAQRRADDRRGQGAEMMMPPGLKCCLHVCTAKAVVLANHRSPPTSTRMRPRRHADWRSPSSMTRCAMSQRGLVKMEIRWQVTLCVRTSTIFARARGGFAGFRPADLLRSVDPIAILFVE